MTSKVITRFPPSPTGFLHIGRARTALFNYLFAKHHDGTFFFRFEDTDPARSKKEFETEIIEGLSWLGIKYDNKEIWRQTERTEIYKSHLKRLFDSGNAYLSKETEGERAEVIRFKNPNKVLKFTDLIRGEISFDTTDLGDFVIAKSLDEPLYHLAVLVDDMEMAVTHVIRGEEGISNTPRQILLLEALGFPRPEYAHLPLILAPDRSKLSGRHGAVSVNDYKNSGYLPEALLNYLALLGWNPGDDREIFSLPELVEAFDLSKVQKGGAIFNIEKLNWFNRHYMTKLSPAEKLARLSDFAPNESFLSDKLSGLQKTPPLIELLFERVATFGELRDLLRAGEFNYFFGAPAYDKSALLWKGRGEASKTADRLNHILSVLDNVPESSFNKENVKAAVWAYAESEGRGEVLWPFRVSLSGREKSPDPFTLSEVLGKKETLSRLHTAINLLSIVP